MALQQGTPNQSVATPTNATAATIAAVTPPNSTFEISSRMPVRPTVTRTMAMIAKRLPIATR